MHGERVTFQNEAGHTLAGVFTQASETTSKHCVILCHGYLNDKDCVFLPALAERLAAQGFNALRFDFRGNKDSEGSFGFGNYWEEVEDIAAAKAFLEHQHQQDVIALVGHSKGGDDVVLYASKYGNIPLVVNICGRFWLDAGIAQRFGANYMEQLQQGPITINSKLDDGRRFQWQLTKQDVEARLAIDMTAACAAIKGCRVLTIHGEQDRTIPVADGRQFAALIPNSQLHIVPEGDHNFTRQRAVDEMMGAVVRFIVEGARKLAEGAHEQAAPHEAVYNDRR